MGWWKVEGTENTIGDAPLDTLNTAILEVVAQYQALFHRKPTKAEWEALLLAALGSDEEENGALDKSHVINVTLEIV
jgi:hypothetical protein